MLRSFTIAWVVAIVALSMTACSDDGGGSESPAAPTVEALTLADVTAPGPYAVGSTTYQFVDTTRPTAASGDVPGSDERLLTTEVWYPAVADPAKPDGRDAKVDTTGGRYPLIVFAHGLSSSRLFSPAYTRHLASRGYIVVAPDFPLTRIGTPGGTRFLDTVNQAGDVSYVIDAMLAYNQSPGHLLEGAINAERIGLTGHSGGAFTTLITLYGIYGAKRDDRIDAALPISGTGCFYDASAVGDVDTPIMTLTGSEDLIVPRRGNRRAYEQANAPRYFVEVLGANHVRFTLADVDDATVAGAISNLAGTNEGSGEEGGGDGFLGGGSACFGDADPAGEPKLSLARQQEVLNMYATPFFDAYLRDDAASLRFLREQLPALSEGVAVYEFEAE